MADNKEVPSNENHQALPIFYEPEGFSAVYSDNVVVVHTENEFILSFFQAEYSYPLGADMDSKTGSMQISGEVKQIKARCVSRVIMSPNQMIKLVNVLQNNLAKYLKKAEQAKKIEEGS